MATKPPLQLDDLTDGDLVEFDRGEGHRSLGIYRGFEKTRTPPHWWLIWMEDARGRKFAFLSRSAKSVRVLNPAGSTES